MCDLGLTELLYSWMPTATSKILTSLKTFKDMPLEQCTYFLSLKLDPPIKNHFPVFWFQTVFHGAKCRSCILKRKSRVRKWRKSGDVPGDGVVGPLGLSPRGHGSSRGETSVRALSCPRLALLAFYWALLSGLKGRRVEKARDPQMSASYSRVSTISK